MKKSTYLAAASTAFVLAASVSTVALAWHPEGKITKEVANVTMNSAYADANDATTAIIAHPGDTLRYRMTVVNPAAPAEQQYHDLAAIKVSDTLPAGVTVNSGAKDKDFGSTVVVPQATTGNGTKSVSYDFTVKVNDNVKDGTIICNIAAFSGNSITGDAPRSGVDQACVKVVVPPAPKQIQVCELSTKKIVTIAENTFNANTYSKDLSLCEVKPVTPVTPTTPATPVTPATPEVAPLPSTGPMSTLLSVAAAAVMGAIAYASVIKFQRSK